MGLEDSGGEGGEEGRLPVAPQRVSTRAHMGTQTYNCADPQPSLSTLLLLRSRDATPHGRVTLVSSYEYFGVIGGFTRSQPHSQLYSLSRDVAQYLDCDRSVRGQDPPKPTQAAHGGAGGGGNQF